MNERELEKQLKALANRRRLAILKYLKTHREAAVSEIAGAIHLSLKATSKHLGVLAALDIVERDQRSLQAFYCLTANNPPAVKHILYII
ncbi:MAG TPA: metalloregulator ArsR/SmtB family transcription factor [Candidatus Paceibacterota bacterium]|nr:metalloregulator ArsR/SmtB family transcription factor [Candidatus Paceibacterota bacterium]